MLVTSFDRISRADAEAGIFFRTAAELLREGGVATPEAGKSCEKASDDSIEQGR